jgi:hypothetical protein
VTVVRILVWNLADSKTTLDEIREHLPELPPDNLWIANEPQERFGVISYGDTLPDLDSLRDLTGKEPEVAEEYDLLS